jgi:hypothetical protein
MFEIHRLVTSRYRNRYRTVKLVTAVTGPVTTGKVNPDEVSPHDYQAPASEKERLWNGAYARRHDPVQGVGAQSSRLWARCGSFASREVTAKSYVRTCLPASAKSAYNEGCSKKWPQQVQCTPYACGGPSDPWNGASAAATNSSLPRAQAGKTPGRRTPSPKRQITSFLS